MQRQFHNELSEEQTRTEEERVVEQLIHLRSQEDLDVTILPFPWPDIVCALPDEAVRDVLDAHGCPRDAFPGWAELVERFRSTGAGLGAPKFKLFVLDTLDLEGMTISALIAESLDRWDGSLPHAHPLQQPMNGLLAAISETQEST